MPRVLSDLSTHPAARLFRLSRPAAILVFAALMIWPAGARSQEVLLSLSSRLVDDAPIMMTRADLSALPQARIQTTTEWTDGEPVFAGPLARDVVALMTGHGEKMANAIAVNDYSVEIPLTDFEKYDVILALNMNGKDLSLRDKGPIWIVYPRDRHEELKDPSFNSRWIWQLDRIELR